MYAVSTAAVHAPSELQSSQDKKLYWFNGRIRTWASVLCFITLLCTLQETMVHPQEVDVIVAGYAYLAINVSLYLLISLAQRRSCRYVPLLGSVPSH